MDDKDKYLRMILSSLDRLSYDDYMNLCYNMMITFPQDVLSYDDVPTDHKLEILEKLISYFSEKEEYEKCNEIKKMKNLLKGLNDNIC